MNILKQLENLVLSSDKPVTIVSFWYDNMEISYKLGEWTVEWNGGTGCADNVETAINKASDNSFYNLLATQNN
jgi:hypothetical protein